jgi:HAD superfamily hydrolase (TIGR01490 family)
MKDNVVFCTPRVGMCYLDHKLSLSGRHYLTRDTARNTSHRRPDHPVRHRTYPVPVTTAPERSAAFFDLDKTVIARSSTLAFSRPFYAGGLITRRAMLRSAYAHFFYQVNGADHDQMERMRRYLSSLTTGWDVQQVRVIVAETLTELISPLVYEEATTLIAEHHEAGRDVVIVSASGAEVVEPIGTMLGADHVVATQMVVEDGRYTGDIDFYAYGVNKATAIRELAAERGYDLAASYAYSDSATDVPMLEAVGHPFAVNADKALRREATARGWPLLDFTKPVRMRTRRHHNAGDRARAAAARLPGRGTGTADDQPRQQSSGPAVAMAIGAGAATAAAATGIVWLATRRRLPGSRAS